MALKMQTNSTIIFSTINNLLIPNLVQIYAVLGYLTTGQLVVTSPF